jgi:hypothetical protein
VHTGGTVTTVLMEVEADVPRVELIQSEATRQARDCDPPMHGRVGRVRMASTSCQTLGGCIFPIAQAEEAGPSISSYKTMLRF